MVSDGEASGEFDGRSAATLALARGASCAEAAQKAGVHPNTISRWKQDPDFRAEVTRIRGALLDEMVGQLISASADAVSTLRLMLASEESDANKIRAARAILTSMITVRAEVDIEERLRRVEEAVADREAGPWPGQA